MNQQDYDQFGELLNAVAELYGKTMKPMQTAMYFRALEAAPLEAVQAAFDAHAKDCERGRFMPMPADLLAKLEQVAAQDGRPSPEEAWGVAIKAADEAQTVVWTVETERAWWDVASPLYSIGDKFNASRGFMTRYVALVAEARKRGERVRWTVTQGTDRNLRDQAVREAYRLGRVTRETAIHLLPHNGDTGPVLAAIAGKVVPLLANKQAAETTPDRVAEIQGVGRRLASLIKPKTDLPARPDAASLRRIVLVAEDAGVLRTVAEIEHWMGVAAQCGDLSALQAQMLEGRRHA